MLASPPQHAIPAQDAPPAQEPDLGTTLRPVIDSLIKSLDYAPLVKPSIDPLIEAMHARASQMDVPYLDGGHAQKCFEMGSFLTHTNYPEHPLDVKLHIASLTWLGLLIDDTTPRMFAEVEQFQERFYSGQAQPTPLLQSFAGLLRSTYEFYDPVAANFIILSWLAFVNSNVLATRDEFVAMTPSKGGRSWSYHFRDKEGLPEAYAYFTFPKAQYPDISSFLEAIPDMGVFMNLANDVLSFYKEEKAGETKNYIHNRCDYAENETVLSTLESTAVEAAEAFGRVQLVLQGRDAYAKAWKALAMGWVEMHMVNQRYRLSEILVEKAADPK